MRLMAACKASFNGYTPFFGGAMETRSSRREVRIRVPFLKSILVGEPSQTKKLVKGLYWGTWETPGAASSVFVASFGSFAKKPGKEAEWGNACASMDSYLQ